MRMPNHLWTKSKTCLRKAFSRAPRAPTDDKTKGTNKALRARAAVYPGVAHLSHFGVSKKGPDTTPHILAAAPHGRVPREASRGYVHQDTHARRIKTKQVGPPGAGVLGRTRISKSAPNALPIAVLGIQRHIPQLL